VDLDGDQATADPDDGDAVTLRRRTLPSRSAEMFPRRRRSTVVLCRVITRRTMDR
jgi:hypothetical protein